ncbi:MAG: DSD1 family PLP-dependent enzyme [Pseudomonadota bacterium]
MSLDFAVDTLLQRPYEPIALPEPLSLEDLPTPALILNLPRFEGNLGKMAEHMSGHGKGFRPHAKTHKCATIAHRQIEAGAVGICVAKVSEGLAMAQAGIDKILVTSPVTTTAKARLVGLLATKASQLQIVVDSEVGLRALLRALPDSLQQPVGVLIDIDIEMGRTGNRSLEDIVRLIEIIQQDHRVQYAGIQHYAGHLMHLSDFEERKTRSLNLWSQVEEMAQELIQMGFGCQVMTGGGTGTFDIDVHVAGLTDMQVGSYIFMDEEYRLIQGNGADRFDYFDASLTVACSTISAPTERTITVDGGYKAFASDSVEPVCDELPDTRFKFAGDEHGVLIKPRQDQYLKLGQVLQFVVPHCDPTVNLHEFYWVQNEDGLIREVWPINARGCSW